MRIAIIVPAMGKDGIQLAIDYTQRINEDFLRRVPNNPWIYESGVRYQREDRCDDDDEPRICSEERFLTIPEAMRLRVADCDDIASWRAAELRVKGWSRENPVIDPGARALVIEVGPGQYHVVVRLGNGAIEDPCIKLGMRV